jgi:hypothetical protein
MGNAMKKDLLLEVLTEAKYDYRPLHALWFNQHIRYHCLKDHAYLLKTNKEYQKLFGYEFKNRKQINGELNKTAATLNLLFKLMDKKKK